MWPPDWDLKQSFYSEQGSLPFDVLGSGPPLVLVHGTPTWSYLWHRVAAQLSQRFAVHLYDLPGYGRAERFTGQDPSIAAQARILACLVKRWGLRGVPVVGHDIGGAIALGAHLLHDAGFSAILLLDAVVTAPWITPTTRHQQKWLEAYRTMPVHIYERVAGAHLATAFHKAPAEDVFAAYFEPWRGAEGQAAWYRNVERFDESYSFLIVPPLKELRIPVRVVWGEHDAWLSREVAEAVVAAAPPGTELRIVPGAGHFSPEDNPLAVADEIARFVQ